MNAVMTHTSWISIKQRLPLWCLITLSCVLLGPPFGAVWYSTIAAVTHPPSAILIIIFAVPFSYIYGGMPALIGGSTYALCVCAWGHGLKFTWWRRMLLGMLLGGLACMMFLHFVPLLATNGSLVPTAVYISCGVFAGAMCAWRYRLTWIEQRLKGTEV